MNSIWQYMAGVYHFSKLLQAQGKEKTKMETRDPGELALSGTMGVATEPVDLDMCVLVVEDVMLSQCVC